MVAANSELSTGDEDLTSPRTSPFPPFQVVQDLTLAERPRFYSRRTTRVSDQDHATYKAGASSRSSSTPEAESAQTLCVTGVEAEAEIPFSSLELLVRPLLGQLDALPEVQASSRWRWPTLALDLAR